MHDAIATDSAIDHLCHFIKRYQKQVQQIQHQLGYEGGKKFYIRSRALYNRLVSALPHTQPSVSALARVAALFILLCTLAFSSIYRENRYGAMTSPYRSPASSLMNVDKYIPRVRALHTYYSSNHVSVTCQDFEAALMHAKFQDFVYMDPPYWRAGVRMVTYGPASVRAWQDQERVARVFKELARRGCHVMLSTSDTPEIRALYRGMHIHKIPVVRTVAGRNALEHELVILSYSRASES